MRYSNIKHQVAILDDAILDLSIIFNRWHIQWLHCFIEPEIWKHDLSRLNRCWDIAYCKILTAILDAILEIIPFPRSDSGRLLVCNLTRQNLPKFRQKILYQFFGGSTSDWLVYCGLRWLRKVLRPPHFPVDASSLVFLEQRCLKCLPSRDASDDISTILTPTSVHIRRDWLVHNDSVRQLFTLFRCSRFSLLLLKLSLFNVPTIAAASPSLDISVTLRYLAVIGISFLIIIIIIYIYTLFIHSFQRRNSVQGCLQRYIHWLFKLRNIINDDKR